MKHLAIIQSEFLKEARNWDDLSLEEQKGYLKRHPASRRKLTAKLRTESDDIKDKIESKRKSITNEPHKLPGQEQYQQELDNFREKLLSEYPILYHSTSKSNAKKINEEGFTKKYNYFSMDEGAWDEFGKSVVKIKTKDVIDRIFPDPEGQLPEEYVNEIVENNRKNGKSASYSWNDVRKNPTYMKGMFKEIEQQYGDLTGVGNFVVDGPITK